MKKDDNISIVVASDDHYAIHIAALMKSIEVNHKTLEHIDFYIIDDGISKSAKNKLNATVDPQGITIHWFNSQAIIPSDITIPIDSSAFPLTVYLRIFSPYVVDETVNKLIYLDVDTILYHDISELWNTKLDNYTIGAVQDVGKTVDCEWAGIPNYRELGLEPDTKYFNSGVLIINPQKWRSEDITNKVMLALREHKDHVKLADQYGLNVVMAKKWKELDPKWNWFAFNENSNPFLVHFLDIKPIFSSYNSKEIYKEDFFKYLSMTPWRNFKPISGNFRLIRKSVNKLKKAFMKMKSFF